MPVTAGFGELPTFSDDMLASPKIIVVRLTGFMRIASGGEYTFRLTSDDGSRLIIAGRGQLQERIVVDNDGEKGRLLDAEGKHVLDQGLHFFRLEYLKIPPQPGINVYDPPGLIFEYKGPDTGDVYKHLQTALDFVEIVQKSDNICQLSRFSAGFGGTSASIDCTGKCFDGREDFLGDGRCDQGGANEVVQVMNFQCSAWNFDNRDCSFEMPALVTTPRPAIQCYSQCPPGNFRRNDCDLCPSGLSVPWNAGSIVNGWCRGNEITAVLHTGSQ
jgi:hypothetical protein